MPGVWASTSGVPAHFPAAVPASCRGRQTPCRRGAGCRHCAVRAVRPSMALTDGGFDHARCQSAGRLPHPSSLSYPAVRVRHERTRHTLMIRVCGGRRPSSQPGSTQPVHSLGAGPRNGSGVRNSTKINLKRNKPNRNRQQSKRKLLRTSPRSKSLRLVVCPTHPPYVGPGAIKKCTDSRS